MDDAMKQMAKKLQNNPAALQSLIQSRDGQKLIQMMQQIGGSGLQQAVRSASKGKPAELSQMIQQMMQQPEGADLVQRIQKAVTK